jgi:hypothetical protein
MWSCGVPVLPTHAIQYSLYQTDRMIVGSGSLEYDCLSYYVANDITNNEYFISETRQFISYCVRPVEVNEISIEEPTIDASDAVIWTFEQLHEKQLSSQQLYEWSGLVDLVEQYQIYLDKPNESLGKQFFYNCSLPFFGQFCEYKFDSKDLITDIVKSIFMRKKNYDVLTSTVTNGTCYIHIKCDLKPESLCLDWREICDGKVDCIDNDGIDEYDCDILEENVCSDDEFQCHNGQCIPIMFYRDDFHNPDCLDGSDEGSASAYLTNCFMDPAFRCEERSSFNHRQFACGDGTFSKTQPQQLFSYCHNHRDRVFRRTIMSYDENPLLSYECWSTMIAYTDVTKFDELWYDDFQWPCHAPDKLCLDFIQKNCEPLFTFPASPMFGHVRFLYSSNETFNKHHLTGAPKYICFIERTCKFISTTTTIKINESTCHLFTDLTEAITWRSGLQDLVNILRSCSSAKVSNETQCKNASMKGLFKCKNSPMCIFTRRVADGNIDCSDRSDEQTNFSCALNDSRRFVCSSEDKCISHLLVRNGLYDCLNGEDEEPPSTNYHLFFILCDGFRQNDVIKFVYTGNDTDETDCEYWPCNNMYTRCDGFWNCQDGRDELNCSKSCAANEFKCVSAKTFDMTCLPAAQAGDGRVDCLGGSDERFYCRNQWPLQETRRYQCWNSTNCIHTASMCDETSFYDECPFKDDERFCEITDKYGICHRYSFMPLDQRNPSRDFLCKLDEEFRPTIKYFSLGEQIDRNELISKLDLSQQQEVVASAVGRDEQQNSTGDLNTVWLCNRGVLIWRQARTDFDHRCLCPPSYYGHRCQFQNQRISLSFRIHTFDWYTVFNVVIMLTDNITSQIHSYEQHIFLSARDCNVRFDVNLLYSDRPKNKLAIYTIRIDVFDKNTMHYRASFQFPIKMSFLPVYRISTILSIPLQYNKVPLHRCSEGCVHGECVQYINTQRSFCRCIPGWSGLSCQTQEKCNCASDSICLGFSHLNRRSVCVCPLDKFGPRCLLNQTACHPNSCLNGAMCVPADVRLGSFNYTCVCKQGYTGILCEHEESRIKISFGDDVGIPSSSFVHFITVIPNASPLRATTVKKIAFDQISAVVYIATKFHIVFVEFAENYYLAILRSSNHLSAKMYSSIKFSDRCPSINELFNTTMLAFPSLRRLKYYHIPCQEQSDLRCFYDKEYMCLCTDESYSNCFEFNHTMTYNCNGSNYCQNGAQCFQNHPTCPSAMMCVCDECFYGSKCQFSTKGFSLSIDTILGYHIRPHISLLHQFPAVKVSAAITVIMLCTGMVSSTLSILTFHGKNTHTVGCGLYLLTSSITSICAMAIFTIKFCLVVLTQMGKITNYYFLIINCVTVDFLLKILLGLVDWLNASVAVERTITALRGVNFDKTKSRRAAKWVIISLLIVITLTSIHDPLYRQLINDVEEQRTWCIVFYSPRLQTFNSAMNLFHFLAPFFINFISALLLIIAAARNRSVTKKQQSYMQHFYAQLHQHKHLLISSTILIVLTVPRIIISLVSGCIKSTRNPWLFLAGYFVSFIPPLLTFIVFVLPSKMYKKEFYESLKRKRTVLKICSLRSHL